ncbi:MAG: hypothetical protein ACD_38C00164G0005 [uncultured bacterium]|uniref:DUF948 domain-containing protein n=1 Tax=Candidatus Daviesbacteria bacterium GW2011_GWC2_40_12 TaxID=1618431 RepID=A0A0G0QXH0_9BACT|nr:MAG: hypothetical protein ACD_38C00164G0005 [uncultured bacterium]KKQ84700.1 MAG: hypothetical protein UT04_C0012G0005 [Candidatus Daviesbacteria bacterium GW2011_GWF2_38_7]KKR17031.1 MAG: hypothetical protein UT45_C0003G0061 [Candidatus Daviesbacteria bacterium GW2011_GWA2_39_33]KKR23600.1 MAG: hypothetical protein UT54_C0043G0005 [Candidatus Daviesbacteria bacterium GW2011_GWB1_39_5]KKR42096.1 MAG: hypothetical protein UT77_C0004G0080 [Candidatus Daviesbacteria bacterium GW2011_GWC2_40_12]
MDLLQIALIFLILLLSVFLAITGIQVFFILRDLKKALDKFNAILQTGENIAEDIERPVAAASVAVTGAGMQAVANAAQALRKVIKPKPKRFYKKVL